MIYQAFPGMDVSAPLVTISVYVGTTGELDWNATVGAGTSLTLFLFQLDDTGNVYIGYGDQNLVVSIRCYTPSGSQKWTVNNPLGDFDPF